MTAPSLDPLSSRDLAAFVAAVESGSVQGAADGLVLTQSAVTKRIQSLERALGVELLHRSRRGVRLTAAGQRLYPEAKEGLTALHHAERRVRADARAADLTLTLTASHTIGGYLLPQWLAGFRAIARDTVPRVEILNSPAVLSRVRAGETDVGFVEGTDELTGLETLHLETDELVVLVAAGHRWARRSSVRPDELPSEPFYARERGSGTRAVAEQRLAERGIELRPSLEMTSVQSLKRATLTAGFTLLSRRAVDGESGNGLVVLRVRGMDLRRDLVAVRVPRRRTGAAAEQLWHWLARRTTAESELCATGATSLPVVSPPSRSGQLSGSRPGTRPDKPRTVR